MKYEKPSPGLMTWSEVLDVERNINRNYAVVIYPAAGVC